MRELHLFAGIGGGILGGMLLGHRCVGAVEIDPFCRRVLEARQRDGILEVFPIHDDIRTFDGTAWRGRVDVVCGGFPCQDISDAGKRVGLDGARSGLWTEMLRVVREAEPQYVFVENVPGLLVRGFDRVLGALADLGFDAEWCVRSAADVGAPHLRKRLWILAAHPGRIAERRELDAAREGSRCAAPDVARDGWQGLPVPDASGRGLARNGEPHGEANARSEATERRDDADGLRATLADAACRSGGQEAGAPIAGSGGEAARTGQEVPRRRGGALADPALVGCQQGRDEVRPRQPDVARHGDDGDANGTRLAQRQDRARHAEEQQAALRAGWWATEPDVGRVAHGVPARVDRMRALGNAQVPLQAATAFAELMQRMEGAIA